MNRSMRLACTTGAALAVLAMASACGANGSTASAQVTADFAGMFDGYGADYEPADSPAELATQSSLVVEGRISKVVPGLTYSDTPDDSLTYQTAVMQFRIDRVLAGRAPVDARSLVYVELPAPHGLTAADFDRAAPKDAAAVLYLAELPDPRTWSERVLDPQAGRPSGQPLMTFTTPQGFIVSAGADEAVSVFQYDGHTVKAPLDRFRPTERSFPDIGHAHD